MSAAVDWYATKSFKGIDINGKPCDFSQGDLVPNVDEWPTFNSLKNIAWITDKAPKGHVVSGASKTLKPKTEKKQVKAKSEKKAKTIKKSAKVTKTKTKKQVTVKAADKADENISCDQCEKTFTSSRALNVHKRYHK